MGKFLRSIEHKVDAFADAADRATSDSRTFLFALLLVVLWGVSGPHFDYSNRWQLVINTGTTIATFLLGFLIKNNQQRSTSVLMDWIAALYNDHGTQMEELKAICEATHAKVHENES
ncbi:MAG TPA: low affinity iron permease family protein [Gammaproteobacteria bacterium]|nr:low affinity iron permease family protein [Gammaproteobacteria bacterium]